MPKLRMNPPTRREALAIPEQGKPKYGWHWIESTDGSWWGTRPGIEVLLQVRPEPPDFPTRRWNATSQDGFTPHARLEPLRAYLRL